MSDCACGDDGVATETRYIEILEFTHFVRFFNFHTLDIIVKKKGWWTESQLLWHWISLRRIQSKSVIKVNSGLSKIDRL